MPTLDSIEVLSVRLTNAENKINSIEDKVERAFRDLHIAISGLNFLRNDVYLSDQRSITKEFESLNKKADNTIKIAMWSLGTVASLTIAAVIGILLRVVA